MKSGTALVAMLFASASFPILAQQPSPASQPSAPATQPAAQQNPSAAEPAPQAAPAAETPTAPMSPVNGELVSKLDSKTAKAGDNVEVLTKASVKTADGTEIPKGSKLVGHVVGAQASGAGTNSQVVLEFDRVELKGGQSLPVHSQIQSISPPGDVASAGGPASMSGGATSAPQAGSSSSMSANSQRSSAAPQSAGTTPPTTSGPVAGTIVAKNGSIAIQTTAIPGVLLANNAPGEQDPRMAKASSILLGARKDIQLDGGTQMVVGVATASGGGQ